MKRPAPAAKDVTSRRTPPHRARRIIITGSVLVGVMVAAIAAVLWPRTRSFYTDADTIKEPAETAGLRDILWQPPSKLPDLVDSAADEYEPKISADGMTLYFVRGRAGRNADIYHARRTHEGWTGPEPLAEVNTEFDELGPEPAVDGQAIYFYSDRPGGSGGYDLWVVRRGLDGRSAFGEATNLGPAVNSEFNDYGPALTSDGLGLYFASNRPQPSDTSQPDPDAWPGTIREDLYHRTYDLYLTPITEQGPGRAQPLAALNTTFNEGAPAVSPFGDFVYFASDRPGGEGGFDLYRSRRLEGAHQPPLHLGSTLNTWANELDPGLTLGGYALYFSSDRPAERREPDQPNPYQVYQTTSREVFRDQETHHVSIQWAALWSAMLPNLLWALLALALLLLLRLAFGRGLQSRKLSLLMRCLLASLALHMLLMLLLNVWEVTSAIARELGRRGPIQIALVAPAKGDDIVAQIRGEFTEVEAPTPATDSLQRELPPVHEPPAPQLVTLAVQQQVTVTREPPHLPRTFTDAAVPSTASTPAVEPVVPADAVATRLDVRLPAEERRLREPEPEAPALPEPPGGGTIERPGVTHALHGRDDLVPQALLAPSPGVANEAPELRERLAFAPTPSDAVVAPPAPAATLPAPSLPLDRLPSPELALPVSAPARVSASEPQGTPNEAFLSAGGSEVRAAPLAPPETGSSGDMPTLAPVNTGLQVRESSLVEPAATQSTGARVAISSGAVERPTASDLPAAPMEPLAIPALEESSAAAEVEATTAPADVACNDVRPPLGELVASASDSSATAFDLTPAGQGSSRQAVEHLGDGFGTPHDAPASTGAIAAPSTRLATLSVPGADLGLRLPTEVAIPNDPYAQRAREQRLAVAKGMGGTDDTEVAVQLALTWLAEHQSADGRWDGADFDDDCGRCGGQTDVKVDSALTGLALLCFLAADHTHDKEGPYRGTVDRALEWLLQRQSEDGDLRGPETMYSQGIATIALAEALGMTREGRLRAPVQRAVEFIERARNEATGIWRYDPGQPGDTSVLGWQIMALKSARTAGASVSMEPFYAAGHWLDRVSTRSRPGLYAYQPGREATASMTAEGLFIQQMLGRHPDEPRMRQSVAFLLEHLPDWEEEPNTYYWYYATLAMFHHQGEPWQQWNRALVGELLPHQRRDGAAAGSWDPEGEWAETGGRVYQTALCTLMLEVYYRYLPLLLNERPADAIGTITGQVTDAATGEPLPESKIKLDLPDRPAVEVSAGADGRYEIFPPAVPPFFALSATADGHVPASKNVATVMVEGTTLELDFQLESEAEDIIAIEAAPEVHHLGDDQFTGRINSRFQKGAEGDRFSATVTLSRRQLPPFYGRAAITMLVKGVQVEHRIRINGRGIADRLDWAPGDGSFGEFSASFDPDLLIEGPNRVEIIAGRLGDDVDDFEFVNLQIRLAK